MKLEGCRVIYLGASGRGTGFAPGVDQGGLDGDVEGSSSCQVAGLRLEHVAGKPLNA